SRAVVMPATRAATRRAVSRTRTATARKAAIVAKALNVAKAAIAAKVASVMKAAIAAKAVSAREVATVAAARVMKAARPASSRAPLVRALRARVIPAGLLAASAVTVIVPPDTLAGPGRDLVG